MRTTRRRVLFVSTFAASLLCAAPRLVSADEWKWNFNVEYGTKSMSESDWSPFKRYEEVGVEASWGKEDEPLMFATDVYVSSDDAIHRKKDVESKSQELALGLRKFWTVKKRWIPYMGAGLNVISTDFERVSHGDRESQKDRVAGLWIGGGVLFRIGSQLNLGVAARLAPARNMSLFGEPRNATSAHIGVLLGWGSPLAPSK